MLDTRPLLAAASRASGRSITAASIEASVAEPGAHGLRPWLAALLPPAGAPGSHARVVRLTAELPEDTGKWAPALILGALGPAERADLERLPRSPRRRMQWLLGRLAAKEVVGSFVRDPAGDALPPADIEIGADDAGAPIASFRTRLVPVETILLSIAHTGDTAVALGAAWGPVEMGTVTARLRGVGIDVEQCRSRPAVERRGLTSTERGLLTGLLPAARSDLATRIWCAKEAAAKALGAGLDRLGGPQSIAVTPLRHDGARLRVDIKVPPLGRSRVLYATTYRDGDLIVATVLDVGA